MDHVAAEQPKTPLDEVAPRGLVGEQHRESLQGVLGKRRRLSRGPCRVLAELLPLPLPAHLRLRWNEGVAWIIEELVAVHD